MRGPKRLLPVLLSLALLGLLAVGPGCSDDSTMPDTGRIDVGFGGAGGDLYVPSKSIMFDNLNFFNAAGQKYSITNFRYVLSDFRFYNTGGGASFSSDDVHLFNVSSQDSNYDDFISFFNVPAGTYNRLSFTFGLDETDNVAGKYPFLDAQGMTWPAPLGGGYHYMILEGQWIADNDTMIAGGPDISVGDTLGYATHLGRVGTTPYFFTVDLVIAPSLVLEAGETWRIPVAYDTRQWYTNPNLYRFPWQSFIMDNDSLQTVLRENGMNGMLTAGAPAPQPFATN